MDNQVLAQSPRLPPQPIRSRPWHRLHPSTYVGAGFILALLALAIVPGEVHSSGTAAEHGWPWIYLRRHDPGAGIMTPKLTAWHRPGSGDSIAAPLSERDLTEPNIVVRFSTLRLLADIVTAVLVLAVMIALAEWGRRRRLHVLQFSLRSLLLSVFCSACACVWWLRYESQCRREQAVAAVLENLGAHVSLRPAVPSWLAELVDGEAFQRFNCVESVLLGQHSFCGTGMDEVEKRNRCIGDDKLAALDDLHSLRELTLGYTQITDQGMRRLENSRHLEFISLINTEITDDGLQHLSKLGSLKTLELCNTAITDAGLMHLSKIKSLERVLLDGTQVTPKGICRLKQALPWLKATSVWERDDALIGP